VEEAISSVEYFSTSGAAGPSRFRVIAVPRTSKRLQILEGIKFATGDIIYIVDPTTVWPSTLLSHTLTCFENPRVGAVGLSRRVEPSGPRLTLLEVMADFEFSTFNLEAAATEHIDGGSLGLSSSTAAYRTVILKDPAFIDEFTHERWRGSHLDSGDDEFLARWLLDCGWETRSQCRRQVEVATTVPLGALLVRHMIRRSRDRWRSDLRSLFVRRRVWIRHPYVATTMLAGMVDPFVVLVSPILIIYLVASGKSTSSQPDTYAVHGGTLVFAFFVWIHAIQTLELLSHLYRRPRHVLYLPVWMAFSYLAATAKMVALFTIANVRILARTSVFKWPS
jgi:cellulose synthase/poly-beta-1,6-N-acetylglucosamine synthase-like glycosyltransferase